MKKVILLIFIIIALSNCNAQEIRSEAEVFLIAKNQVKYKCDGRKYCSQMNSCEEAKYFLANCPDVKMDGNHDGVPCEKQWCVEEKIKF